MADADMILTTLNDPRNSKALTVKGDALYSLGNFEHAILNYHRAIKHSSSKVSTKHSFRARSNGRIVFFAFVHSTTNQGTLRKVSHFSKSLVFTKSCYFRHAKNTSFQMEQGCRLHKTHQCFFVKMDHSRPLFLHFCIFNTVNKYMPDVKVSWWLDSNRWPLALESTALPTEPQPLPKTHRHKSLFCC